MPRIARATRELQWLGQWVPTLKGEGNPETQPQLGSRAETRPREHGIPSNRASSARGEYVPAPCTHRPSFHSSGLRMRRGPLWLCRILGSREGKSRNKVAVGEPAAGSPPKKKALSQCGWGNVPSPPLFVSCSFGLSIWYFCVIWRYLV